MLLRIKFAPHSSSGYADRLAAVTPSPVLPYLLDPWGCEPPLIMGPHVFQSIRRKISLNRRSFAGSRLSRLAPRNPVLTVENLAYTSQIGL
jgi:hypothetical protein